MKKYLLLGALTLLATISLTAKAAGLSGESTVDTTISPVAALKAIRSFKRDPLGSEAPQALQTAVFFSRDSDTVIITLAPPYMPWIQNEQYPEAVRQVLMFAYMIGNTEAQLVKKVRKDHSYEGALFTIDIYQALRSRGKNMPEIAEIEEWITLKKKNKLRAHFDELDKQVAKLKERMQQVK